jgi:multidrug efflux pump
LRPILMTSFAFIAGVIPLIIASGAGAEMRRVMGIAVFSGMLGVTFLGLLFTPLFYVLVRGVVDRRTGKPVPEPEGIQPLHAWRPSLAAGNEGSSHA